VTNDERVEIARLAHATAEAHTAADHGAEAGALRFRRGRRARQVRASSVNWKTVAAAAAAGALALGWVLVVALIATRPAQVLVPVPVEVPAIVDPAITPEGLSA
jgi:hypothetical protein